MNKNFEDAIDFLPEVTNQRQITAAKSKRFLGLYSWLRFAAFFTPDDRVVSVDVPPRAMRIIDLETTGLDADDEVVEVGAVDLYVDTGDIRNVASQIIRPCNSIPPDACAIHHITDDDVANAPSWSDVWPRIFNTDGNVNVIAFAAHNAKFERKLLGDDLFQGRPIICTLKCALRLWPDAPDHKNQTLRYWRNLPVDRLRAFPPHRALPDAYVTAHILRDLLNGSSVDDLICWSNQPSLLPKVNFGKHRGLRWAEVPDGYLEWLIFKSWHDDEDVIHTAKTILANRKASAGSQAA
jgi:exodeoxyribonuclease X